MPVSERISAKPWETVRRFNDGELAIFVMKQDALTEGYLPRYSYRIGRVNGDMLIPHIAIYAKETRKKLDVSYPSARIKELMYEAEEWINSELLAAHNAP